MYARHAVSVVIALTFIVGCSSDTKGDASARQACRKFRALGQDAGVLSETELVARSRAIRDTSRGTDNTALRDAAERFAAATVNGGDTLDAINDLDAACEAIDL